MENLKDRAARANIASGIASDRGFERSYSVPTPVSSPLVSPVISGPPSPTKMASKESDSTLIGRKSQDTARRPAISHAATMPIAIPSSEEAYYEDEQPFKEHRFVKSTFSKGQSIGSILLLSSGP